MESKKYTVAIDLGESSVVVAVGSKDAKGLITVDGIVSRPCEGVKGGMIDNIAQVEQSVKSAVKDIEHRLNIRILEAYAGISGEFVRFACHSDHVYVTDPQNGVSQSDVDALFERMRHVQAPDNETIMERIPQNYVVDDAKEVKNPVGSFGRRLSSTFNFILCGNTPIQRLKNVLRRLGISMVESYPNALAVAESVLTPDEKEEGVVVLDIGGGLTDLTIYYRNVVRYTISIPMGATAINNDIRSMMIPDKYVEKLKCDYGSAVADMVPENKAVRVNGRTPRESRDILLYNLAVAIEARMSMLVDFVKREIKDSGYEDKLPYGIVLTGGCSSLKNIDELFRRMTDMEVRIGKPMEGINNDSLDLVDSPQYATAVGILMRGMKRGYCATGDESVFSADEFEGVAEPEPSRPPVPPTPVARPYQRPVPPIPSQPGQPQRSVPPIPPQPQPQRHVPQPVQPQPQRSVPPIPPQPQPQRHVQQPVQPQPQRSVPPIPPQPQPQRHVQQPVQPQPQSQRYAQPGQPGQQRHVDTQPEAVRQPVTNVIDDTEQPPVNEANFGSDVNIGGDEIGTRPQQPKGGGVPPKRNWKDVFKRAIDRLNDGFNAAEDEEI